MWITVGLMAWAGADVVRQLRAPGRLDPWLGCVLLAPLFLLTGAWGWADLLVGAAFAGAYALWATLSGGVPRPDARRFALAIASFVAPVLLAALLQGRSGGYEGLVARWAGWAGVSLAGLDRALLVIAAVLLQVSTANLLVRLVLAQVALPKAPQGDGFEAEETVKGGRFIGPLERILLVVLGLAGQLAAGTFIAAAKGILRFPELRRAEDGGSGDHAAEYVLVGTLASWTTAIVTYVLIR